jgi:ParB-like chromosome segregation protein Spo0J
MPQPEFDALVADIKTRGLQEPIILHPGGSILDGVQRFNACRKAWCPPKFKPWEGRVGEEVEFVIGANLYRRHLNDNQRSFIAENLCNLKRGRPKQANSPNFTQRESAALLNVKERNIRTARRIVDKAPPNVASLAKQGRISLRAGETVAKLPDEDKARFAGMAEGDVLDATKSLTRNGGAISAKKPQSGEALIRAVWDVAAEWVKANEHARAELKRLLQEPASAATLDALRGIALSLEPKAGGNGPS